MQGGAEYRCRGGFSLADVDGRPENVSARRTSLPSLIFHKGLGAALVQPAQKFLTNHGVQIRFKARLRGIRWSDNRVTSLHFPEGMLHACTEDAVVLALSPEACNAIWPEANAPTEAQTIINAHFRLDTPSSLPWDMPFLGLVNAETHWIFVRDNIVSLTISAGNNHADSPNWEIATKLWAEGPGSGPYRGSPARVAHHQRAPGNVRSGPFPG